MIARTILRATFGVVACALVLAATGARVAAPTIAATVVSPAPEIQQPDAVATALARCLDHAQTTIDMNECYGKAVASYDAVLAKIYPEVLANVDPATRTLIRASQQRWLAYRAAERAAFGGGNWRNDRGTIVGVEIGTADVALVHDRIAALYLFWPGYSHGPDIYPFTDPNATVTPK